MKLSTKNTNRVCVLCSGCWTLFDISILALLSSVFHDCLQKQCAWKTLQILKQIDRIFCIHWILSNDAKKCEFWTWNGAKKSASFKKAANPSNFTYENQLRDSREQTFQNFGDRYTGMPCSTEGPSTLNYIELSCASWNRSQDIWSPPIHSNCSSKLTEKSVTFRQRASRMSRAIDTLRSQLSCALPQGAQCDDLRRAECAYH